MTTTINEHEFFQGTFSRFLSEPVIDGKQSVLQAALLATKLGPVLVLADEEALHFLAFIDCKNFEREVAKLQQKAKACIVRGKPAPSVFIERELALYFEGKLQRFTTPLHYFGTPFQQRVWQALQQIPYGKTCSYAQLAVVVGNPLAFRAAALANSVNQLAIIIPCHRVINSGGALGGYAGSITRKKWLIDHERLCK